MLRERLGKEMLIFDGAMGTQLQKAGLKAGEIPETYNIDRSDLIVDIHCKYLDAGASFITTNTFGCNPIKMKNCQYSYKDMIIAGLDNALKAKALSNKEVYVVLDIGPIGTLLEPIGTLSFDEAYEIFKSIVEIGKDKADAVLLETMSDLYELKAGILAVKENCDLPLFTTMTFEAHGRTLTGSDPTTFVNVAEGLGVDVLGVNCSLGPIELKPIIDEILSCAHVPVMIQPNAGLPCLKDGCTYFPMSKEEFVEGIRPYMEKGVSIVGGCCGTSYEYIQGLYDLNIKDVNRYDVEYKTRVSSFLKTVTFLDEMLICGERMNPTGKKKLKEALKNKQYDEYVKEAIAQQDYADILDVNTGLAGIDEQEAMLSVLRLLSEVISLPLQIDSSSPEVLEKACRYYNGIPLINSVNAKDEVMDAVFPIVKKYGGVVVGLTLEDGIPLKANERVELAKKIIHKAKDYGIRKENIIIDPLTLTASAQQKEVKETLKALKIIKEELGVHSVLGVSNVSFGLPNRPLLNRTFLSLAMFNGLSMAIINPLDSQLMDTIDAYRVLVYHDKDCTGYIKHQSDYQKTDVKSKEMTLEDMIIFGLKDDIKEKTKELLLQYEPMHIINHMIIPSLNKVGDDYEKHIIFLPQLIQSAETTKLAFEVIKDSFTSQTTSKAKLMICTVEGDVHDIGKNIVKVVCESYGYEVIDLGKDVKVKDVVKAYEYYKPDMIGLSALMTTTVVYMEKTIKALHDANCHCPIMVGGAVVNKEIAKSIGATYYTQDALEAVNLLERLF